MNSGDSELMRLIEAVSGDEQLQVEVGDALGRFRRRRELAIRDMEAAQLLPLGASVAAIRQRCHRSTVYRRVSRATKVARQMHNATKD